MSLARVERVTPGSPAHRAGIWPGDELRSVNGNAVRDVIQYRLETEAAEVSLELLRGGLELTIEVVKDEGTPLGLEVSSAVFDQVRTCDNHCEFCFIYQLPPGMRPSLSVKDDDYRLSFLYGNFTTLTRFTEADLERVVAEGLSPLYVSIHATDPTVRSEMLRNRRGGVSLRWLRALLDHGVEVYGQIVVCPGVNDGEVLEETFVDLLDRYPDLAGVAVVPLGVSRYNREARMRPHSRQEAVAVVEQVEEWQPRFERWVGHPLVHAADEYYLLAGRPFPPAERYGGFPMHEDGVGMARAFEADFLGLHDGAPRGPQAGFFSWVDGAPAEGYRSLRHAGPARVTVRARRNAPVGILTGAYGAAVLAPLIGTMDRSDVRLLPVPNRFFGGTTSVTGLMVGSDIAEVLAHEPEGHRYLLPDVCLSDGRFLDGMTPEQLPRPVEVIATDGTALRAALESR
jgi:putative radical SAM enzyme (TIGR03279 family)